MPIRLNDTDPDFANRFAEFLAVRREAEADVDATVAKIIASVRSDGDEAVHHLTRTFDGVDLERLGMRVSRAEIESAVKACDPAILDALALARDRLEVGQRKLLPTDSRDTDDLGVETGARWTAIPSVGLYVPGGTASYPSSVIMNAVPAKVAGVERIAMVAPMPEGTKNPLVLAAAELVGVDEIYRIGGAQAVAALAYGTETIEPVAKIVGPGNAYVAAAKRQVFGTVGIDMVAGPSEILVLADAGNDPAWIAADLLSQAEHDTAAQAILITDDTEFADAVTAQVDSQLARLPRQEIARESWDSYGAVITLAGLDQAPALVDRIAPEHLEIAVAEPDSLFSRIRHAGAVFLGAHTPEVIGDYVGGSNHVLPTARSARFSSGLSVLDFLKRTSILRCSADGLRALGPAAVQLAKSEGLEAHARAISIRLNL